MTLYSFLVACYATLQSTPHFVGPSLVRLSHFTFLVFLRSMASLLLPKWSSDLKYGPCPPVRNWGGRVSSLVNQLSYLYRCASALDTLISSSPSRIFGQTSRSWNSRNCLQIITSIWSKQCSALSNSPMDALACVHMNNAKNVASQRWRKTFSNHLHHSMRPK